MNSPQGERSVLADSMIRGATSWIALLSSLDESERVDVAVRILHLIASALASDDPDCNRVSVGLEDWLAETAPSVIESTRLAYRAKPSAS
ncbi:MAG: hypothetical protein AAF501_02295 [Pseudomonadota bacterium]